MDSRLILSRFGPLVDVRTPSSAAVAERVDAIVAATRGETAASEMTLCMHAGSAGPVVDFVADDAEDDYSVATRWYRRAGAA